MVTAIPYKNLEMEGRDTGVVSIGAGIPREVPARLEVRDKITILEQRGQEEAMNRREIRRYNEKERAKLSINIA